MRMCTHPKCREAAVVSARGDGATDFALAKIGAGEVVCLQQGSAPPPALALASELQPEAAAPAPSLLERLHEHLAPTLDELRTIRGFFSELRGEFSTAQELERARESLAHRTAQIETREAAVQSREAAVLVREQALATLAAQPSTPVVGSGG